MPIIFYNKNEFNDILTKIVYHKYNIKQNIIIFEYITIDNIIKLDTKKTCIDINEKYIIIDKNKYIGGRALTCDFHDSIVNMGAGVIGNDNEHLLKLLNELKMVTKRQATFKTVICYIDAEVHYFEGHVNGTISYEARGQNGFGYDPLFIPQGYRSTFAELSQEIKNSLSHRAQAIKAFLSYIKSE